MHLAIRAPKIPRKIDLIKTFQDKLYLKCDKIQRQRQSTDISVSKRSLTYNGKSRRFIEEL